MANEDNQVEPLSEHDLESFRNMLRLDSKSRSALFGAIDSAAPAFMPEELGEQISTTLSDKSPKTRNIVRLLTHIYRGFLETENESLDDFLGWISARLTKTAPKEFSPGGKSLEEVRKILERVFTPDSSVVATAKATSIIVATQNPFFAANVLTDVRPLFRGNPPEPVAAMVTHTLRVSIYQKEGPNREHFVTMDQKDLRTLIEVLERALKKETSLLQVVKKSGMKLLTPR